MDMPTYRETHQAAALEEHRLYVERIEMRLLSLEGEVKNHIAIDKENARRTLGEPTPSVAPAEKALPRDWFPEPSKRLQARLESGEKEFGKTLMDHWDAFVESYFYFLDKTPPGMPVSSSRLGLHARDLLAIISTNGMSPMQDNLWDGHIGFRSLLENHGLIEPVASEGAHMRKFCFTKKAYDLRNANS